MTTAYLSLAEFRARTIMPPTDVDALEALAYGPITNTPASGGVVGATNATPIVIQASAAEGINPGDLVTIAGALGNTKANGQWPATIVDSSHFSLNGSAGNGAYTGGATWSALGSAAISPAASYAPSLACPLVVQFTAGGVVGTPGIAWSYSLDGGVTFTAGPALGSGSALIIPGTGAAFLLGPGTIVTGQTFACSLQPPFVETELADWTAYIEARLRKRYAIPFQSPVPFAVKKWLTDIVTKRCYDKRGHNPTSDEDATAITGPYDLALAEIKEAADSKDGLFDLPLVDGSASSGVVTGGPKSYSETSPYVCLDLQIDQANDEDASRSGTYG